MTDYTVATGVQASIDDLQAVFDDLPGSQDFLNTAPADLESWYQNLNTSQQRQVIVGLIVITRRLLAREEQNECRCDDDLS